MSESKEQKLKGARDRDTHQLLVAVLVAFSIVFSIAGLFFYLSVYKAPAEPEILRPELTAPTDETGTIDNELETPEDRQAFLDAHKLFELEKNPQLELMSLSEWNPISSLEIQEVKDKAIRAFESGGYNAAVRLIAQTNDLADAQIRHRQELFVNSMQVAMDSHRLDNYDTAIEAIDMAILLDPLSQSAKVLADRINLLPELVPILNEVSRARAENRPDKELGLLKKVLRIDPERIELAERVKTLTSQIAEESFTTAINQAEQALDRGNPGRAMTSLQTAKNLFPGRDLSFLESRIAALSLRIRLAAKLRDADDASQSERWTRAVELYSAALALDPVNSEATQGLKVSTGIVKSLRQLQFHIDSPLRLGSKNVAATARQALIAAGQFEKASGTLKTRIDQLEIYLQKAAVPAEITILSDGETDIQVRGIGFVGKVKQKMILLVPGVYTLEGRRAGYKSKLVNLTIAFDVRRMSTSVVCDERI